MVHKRGGTDRKASLKFVHWSLHGLLDRELDSTPILFGDECRFNLSTYLNSPNNRYCSTGYTLLIHEVRDVKVGVWCDVSAARIIGQFFVCATIQLAPIHALTSFVNTCTITEDLYIYKERQCSSSHHMQFCAFTGRFGGQHKSGLWLRSPDVNPCYRFLLVGHVNAWRDLALHTL